MDTDASDVEIKLNDQNIVAKTWSLTNSVRGSQQCEAKSGLLVRPQHGAQLRFWAKEKWGGLKQKTLKELTTKQRPSEQVKMIQYGNKISLYKSWKLVALWLERCMSRKHRWNPSCQDASVCGPLQYLLHSKQWVTGGILTTYMTRENISIYTVDIKSWRLVGLWFYNYRACMSRKHHWKPQLPGWKCL